MIRVLVEQEGKVREGGVALAHLHRPRWIDVQGQTPEDVRWLGETFGIHPLALEDLLHLDQRPKLEEYPGVQFLVLHAFTRTGEPCEVSMHEVHAILVPETLITVHADPVPALDRLRLRLLADPSLFARGSDQLLYEVCDGIVDGHLPVLDDIHDALEDLEDEVIRGPVNPALLERILRYRRALVTLRRTVAPAREVFATLARPENARVSGRVAVYFRDVQDHLQRATDSIDAGRELVAGLLDGYRSQLAERTNRVMKRLTLFSAILLPLTFLTGFFGMNFEGIDFSSPALLHGAIAGMVMLPAATVVAFKLLRWI